MKITVSGGSSMQAKDIAEGLKELFKTFGFGNVTITGDIDQDVYDGFLEDELVEIEFTS